MKYRSEAVTTKQEVLEVIVRKFNEANKDYDNALATKNVRLTEYKSGRYDALWELVKELRIYEDEEEV